MIESGQRQNRVKSDAHPRPAAQLARVAMLAGEGEASAITAALGDRLALGVIPVSCASLAG
jgi:hypothetical protein